MDPLHSFRPIYNSSETPVVGARNVPFSLLSAAHTVGKVALTVLSGLSTVALGGMSLATGSIVPLLLAIPCAILTFSLLRGPSTGGYPPTNNSGAYANGPRSNFFSRTLTPLYHGMYNAFSSANSPYRAGQRMAAGTGHVNQGRRQTSQYDREPLETPRHRGAARAPYTPPYNQPFNYSGSNPNNAPSRASGATNLPAGGTQRMPTQRTNPNNVAPRSAMATNAPVEGVRLPVGQRKRGR